MSVFAQASRGQKRPSAQQSNQNRDRWRRIRKSNAVSHHVVRHPLGILLTSGHCCAHALFFLFHDGGDTLLVGWARGKVVACLIRCKYNHESLSSDRRLQCAVLQTFPIDMPPGQPSPVESMYTFELLKSPMLPQIYAKSNTYTQPN